MAVSTPTPWTVRENEGVPLGHELVGPEGQVVALVYEKADADAIAAAMTKGGAT